MTIAKLRDSLKFIEPKTLDRYLDGLRVAGLPEVGRPPSVRPDAAETARPVDGLTAGLDRSSAMALAGSGGDKDVALDLGAALLAHQVELLFGLDALGGGRDAEAPAEADHRLDDGEAVAARWRGRGRRSGRS